MSNISYTCLDTRDDGKSYFEEKPVEVLHDNPLGQISNPFSVKELLFRASFPGTFEWHPAPKKQFIVYLEGEVSVEASGGEKKTFYPGDILLVLDTSGEGHRTTVLTEGKALIIQIES